MCAACRAERERQQRRFAATNGSDFFTDTLGPSKATWGLLAVNVIVFAAMVQAGVSISDPTGADLIAKGANFGPKTLGEGQYWRLITQGFIHIGIFHIAMNMLCLWGLSRQLEKFFGAITTIAIYLLTSVGAALLSLSYDAYRISAGASGPIFGITGALVAFLYYGKHDLTATERRAELNSTVRFALINLVLGLGGHIDNMAHLGGLVTGLLIGVALSRRPREVQRHIPVTILSAAAVILVLMVVPVARAKKPGMDIMKAEDAYHRGDWKTAIALLRERVARAPGDPTAHALLGLCLENDKQLDAAMAEYATSLRLAPSLDWSRFSLVQLQLQKQDYAAARDTLAPVFQRPDPPVGAYMLQGQALAGLKDYNGAIAAFNASVAKQDSSEAHARLAEIYRSQKLTKESEREDRLAAEAKAKEEKEPAKQSSEDDDED